ncbi:MAG: helix-turn-helix domain-containing protein [Sphingomicrobium sp.]
MDEVEDVGAETIEEAAPLSAGARLRAAREEAGMTIEEVATSTRIPVRHLENLEIGDFSKLPAPTYSIGFAKNYAAVVGLDRAQIAEQLRDELGTDRPAAQIDVYEPADPSRAMPKWLIFAALAALAIAVAAFSWLKSRDLDAPDAAIASEPAGAETMTAEATTVPAAGQPVAITAADNVWVQVNEKSGAILFQGEMVSGQRFEIPSTAVAPVLKTGRPEALNITVGTTPVASVGPAGKAVSDVSLLAADLKRAAAAATAPPGNTPRATTRRTASPPPVSAQTVEPSAPATAPATEPAQPSGQE